MAKRPQITAVNVPGASIPINTNFERTAQAFDNTLSRDGSTPNQMEADIDLNGNDLLNVGTLHTNELLIQGQPIPSLEDVQDAAEEALGAVERAEDAAVQAGLSADRAAEIASGLEVLPGFGSRESFKTAVDLGQLDDLAEGVSIQVKGQTYIRRAASTTIPDIPGFDLARTVHKTILTGDWQPRLEFPAETNALKAVLDDMQNYHGDANDICHIGDIVERATQGQTGDEEAVYGYDKVLTDVYTRTAISRVYFIPGNHDSDGFGLSAHEYAWSQKHLMDYIGKQFYSVRMGNLLRVFMGTMTGDAGGNILPAVLDWFDRTLQRNKGCNIEVYLHQPLFGYGSFPEDTKWLQYEAVSDRISASIAAVDNVAFVCSGHVARPENLPNYFLDYGTTMFGVNMHIPRVSADDGDGQGSGSELPYGVLEYHRGATTGTVKLWNAATHNWINDRDIPVTYKYPLDLGAGFPDFDGRYAAPISSPTFDGIVQINRDLWEERVNNGTPGDPNWTSKQGRRPGLNMVLSETAPNASKAGDGLSIDWYVPASVTIPSESGETYNNLAAPSLAGRVSVRKQNGTHTDPTGSFSVELATDGTEGTLRDVITARGSDGQVFAPLNNIGSGTPALGLLSTIGLDNSLLSKGRIFANGSFDDTGESGIYNVLSGGDAATITGIPYTASGGVLIVLNPATPPTSRPVPINNQIQIYIARAVPDGGRIYYRVCSNGSWVSWQRITATVA